MGKADFGQPHTRFLARREFVVHLTATIQSVSQITGYAAVWYLITRCRLFHSTGKVALEVTSAEVEQVHLRRTIALHLASLCPRDAKMFYRAINAHAQPHNSA